MPKIVYVAEMVTAGLVRGGKMVDGVLDSITRRATAASGALSMVGSRGLVGMGAFSGGLRGAAADMVRFGNAVGFVATTAVRNLTGALQGSLSILTRYAAVGTAVVGILGGIAAKLTVIDSAKFESEVGRAAILSQATPEQRASMLSHARDIGVETPFGPMAIAESMKVEAQRGRSPQEIIALTEATKRFAVIANIDMAQAAETLSQVMFQFDRPMQEATKTALQLANATTATALSGQEMFDALKFAGGAAGVFKVNLTEVLAVLGTLRRVTDPSTASTALRNIMLVGSALSEKSPKKLEALGLDEESARKFSFMSGEAKSLVEVVKELHALFAKEPELAMKAGFGTRTLVAFEQIAQYAGRADGFFDALKARIDDTDLAQRQYNETIVLADNLYKRLENTAGAVLQSIGSKLREALSLDSGADKASSALADLARSIAEAPKQGVQEMLDTLGAGMIKAFGTAIAFLVRAMLPVAVAFGDLVFRGLQAAGRSLLDSDELKSYITQYTRMSPEARAAEQKRLEKSLGFPLSDPDGMNRATMLGLPNAMRGRAMLRVIESGQFMDSALEFSLRGLRDAGQTAIDELGNNPTVVAGRRALEEGKAKADYDRLRELSHGRRHSAPFVGVMQSGVVNNYGASSPASRASPARPSGTTRTEAAGK